ncbi:UDP-N-acetylglucosamine--N-acetylmuramyl-(pentapeptide) pyrophosphoryl-undecaprenol N-acetylglucosamine transferase [Niastella caeni]|uniref:UDP-N-acetylglucosamine--N-acetylmuramyl-(Pentapeptide) pyrophosphoryl-undecaprenol N-acetylglucosamine transferase n=1 Tax=Niastella caeni TaxID=2569763 RepID=A0A4S8HNK1_9BACT|nr:glycosyltransferase [Niastella caeni]THU36958.1 UDP-N-acetylglucosamine--N-acetylmuramyl-(pentapeptide) pyrophosphoryl-undecaprenol N-acetylglucosamine transferase [Niastella caeni]
MILPESNNFNTKAQKPIVLLSPLDWGLGHTTRCIPIIHELLHLGCQVIIACNSTQKALLIGEFPQLTYVHLPGYNLKYGKKRWGTIVRIILQTPKILIKINNENTWLNIFLKTKPVDIIISDNRFGLHARGVHSVFITHQLYIKTGLGKLTDRLVQYLNYFRIKQFSTCWVPDYEAGKTLAGELSHPGKLPAIPLRYIGGLSRLNACQGKTTSINLLVILSGPEPQRTIFENLLLQAFKQQPGNIVLVRGLPGSSSPVQSAGNCIIHNHAPAGMLNKLICNSEYVISRSGYTTVMDLLKLGKKSILVPTPGQAEQEYIAGYLHKEHLAYAVSQSHFSLKKVLAEVKTFPYQQPVFDMSAYKIVIGEMIEQIKKAEH